MLQRDFLLTLSRMCRDQDISTALDTAGNVPASWYSPELLENIDLILYDIKAVDPALLINGVQDAPTNRFSITCGSFLRIEKGCGLEYPLFQA